MEVGQKMDTATEVLAKLKCKFEQAMLNLETGKRYKITLFVGGSPIIGTIKFKEVRDSTHHSYWISWWDEKRKQNVGHYIFDTGCANRGVTITYNQYSIRTCEEVNPSSDPGKC